MGIFFPPGGGSGSVSLESGRFVANTGNGLGNGAGVVIRRYTTVEVNVGSGDFYTYVDSATNGASITILRPCKIWTSIGDASTSDAISLTVSINAADITVAAQDLTTTSRLMYPNSAAANFWAWGMGSCDAAINDVLRPHLGVFANGSTNAKVRWEVSFLGL